MDESPLSLFGDQTKQSINYVGTDNEVEGNLGDKRFATVILTAFRQDNTWMVPFFSSRVRDKFLRKKATVR